MDLYEVLGLTASASAADIKRQYKRLANQHHPDKPEGNAEKFKAIKQAYEVLSDKAARQQYDETGEIAGNQETQMIINTLMGLFDSIFENGYISDGYVAEAKSINTRQIIRAISSVDNMRSKVANLERLLGKVECSEGENLVEVLLAAKIKDAKGQLKHIELNKRVLEQVDELLGTYSDVASVMAGVDLLDDDPLGNITQVTP